MARALMSSAAPLYLLEDPNRWQDLEILWVDRWISNNYHRLDDTDLRLFSADCVEHVLPLYRHDPSQTRCRWTTYWKTPERIIEAARRMAVDQLPHREWASLLDEAREASQSIRSVPAWYVAVAAFYLITKPEEDPGFYRSIDIYPRKVWHEATLAAANEVTGDYNSDEWGHAMRAERIWQWRRLLTYLMPR